jgi:hypothetical protein
MMGSNADGKLTNLQAADINQMISIAYKLMSAVLTTAPRRIPGHEHHPENRRYRAKVPG